MNDTQLANIEERSKKVAILVPPELFPSFSQFWVDYKALIAEVKRLRLAATYRVDDGGDAA